MNENKRNPEPIHAPAAEQGEEILQEYQKKFWQNSKFWLGVASLLILAVFALVYKTTVMNTAVSPAELKAAMELFDISSQWVVNDKIDEEDFKGIILVPEVSFRIHNISKKRPELCIFAGGVPLHGHRQGDRGRVPDGFAPGLGPKRESARITLTAGFGYRASSAAAFEKYKQDWRNSFASFSSSRTIPG